MEQVAANSRFGRSNQSSVVARTVTAAARAHASQRAITADFGVWTYSDLLDEVERVASVLETLHARQVAVLAHEPASTLVWLLAALGSGTPISVCAPTSHAKHSEIADLVVGAMPYSDSVFPTLRPRIALPPGSVCLSTAGTSGEPKRIVHDDASLAHAIYQLQRLRAEMLPSTPIEDDVASQLQATASGPNLGLTYLGGMPIWTVAGLTIAFQALCCGDHIVLHNGFSLERLANDIDAHCVTNLSLAPFMAQQLVRLLRRESRSTGDSLLHVGIGGGLAPAAIAADLEDTLAAAVTVGYGATEAGGPISISRLNDSREVRHGTVGRALPGVEVALDEDIVRVRSRSLALGYVRSNGIERFTDADGWWKTGDRGYSGTDGNIVITGRADDLIIRGGKNIDPVQLERALERHPMVEIAAVLSRPGRVGSESDIYALLVCSDQPTRGSIIEVCRANDQTVPQRLLRVPTLPLTDDGVPRRRMLDELIAHAEPI